MTEAQGALQAAHRRIAELESKLRADELRRLLFEHSLDLMCVANEQGRFLELNAAWTGVLGWDREVLTSRPFLDFVHPDDVPATRDAYAGVLQGVRITTFQNRYRHKDGGYRWLSWNAVFDPKNERVFAVARDVTEVVTTREALRASEAAYQTLFNGMLDGFSYHDMIFDEQGRPIDYRFRAVNPAFEEMTGLKAVDLVGRRVLDVLPGTEKHWIEVFGGVAKTGQPVRYENYSREFDKWFEVLAFQPSEGQFACTFHDITARRRAEADRALLQAHVEHAQKLESLGVMAGGIAHDFNNLLTAIFAGIEVARDGMRADPEAAKADLGIAFAAAEQARQLCKQMLSFAGRAEPQKERIDLVALLTEITALARPSFSKKLQIGTRHALSTLPVVLDRGQMSQVVLNLLLNAGEAIGDQEGSISVTSGLRQFEADELSRCRGKGQLVTGPYAFVEIRDSGSGMSEETLNRIFDPFFTTKFAGRGLGLSATLGIVSAHGGDILVESEPGRGTRFVVLLPPPPEESVSAAPTVEAAPWQASGTVLVCDDEAPLRRILARLMNSLGFDVLEARDGEEALAFFQKSASKLRAVLLDLTMPKMGGLEVLPLLRSQRADIPVVLMSGHDEDRLVGGPLDGPVTFLHKPFRREELQSAIRRVIPPL